MLSTTTTSIIRTRSPTHLRAASSTPPTIVPAEIVARARSAFAAFGLGLRGCIGENLAYMELSLALARMLWLYDIRAKAGDRQGRGPHGSRGGGRTRSAEYLYQLEDVGGC
jgi:cytochrome P450